MSFTEPISDSSPAGTDCKYEDDYLEVEIEIEKFFNAASESETDWERLILKCENILKERSKDLKIASYWLFAHWKRGGWDDFFDAFGVYLELAEKFKESIFPVPARRRGKVLEWVESLFEEPLSKDMEHFSKERLERFSDQLARLNAIFADESPGRERFFKDTDTRVRYLLDSAKQRELEALAEAERLKEEEKRRAREQELQASRLEEERREVEERLQKFKAVSHLNTESDTAFGTAGGGPLSKESYEDAKRVYRELAAKMIEESPLDQIAYKPLFLLSEMEIRETLSDGVLQERDLLPLEDIAAAARELCDMSRVTIGQFHAVVEQLEQKPLWLEGYHIVSKLMYKMERAEQAAKIEEELLYLIHRNREVLDMKIGSEPLIPEHMLTWVNTRLLSISGESGTNIEYRVVYEEVLGVLKEQGVQNAFNMLEEHFKKASSEEERFRWRLLFVDFALEIGDKRLALSLLLELEKKIERFEIDLWQPELAIITYEALSKPIISQQLGNEVKDRIYHKLSILDAQKVMNL